MEKQCTKCHETKPLDAYNKSSGGKYGVDSRCRECAKAEQARYRAEHPEKMRESKNNWRKNNPGKQAEYAKQWAERNPEAAKRSSQYTNRMNNETKKTATNLGKRWTPEEDAQLLRVDLTLGEICKLIGRPYGSASVRRGKLRERAERLAIIEEVQKRMAG